MVYSRRRFNNRCQIICVHRTCCQDTTLLLDNWRFAGNAIKWADLLLSTYGTSRNAQNSNTRAKSAPGYFRDRPINSLDDLVPNLLGWRRSTTIDRSCSSDRYIQDHAGAVVHFGKRSGRFDCIRRNLVSLGDWRDTSGIIYASLPAGNSIRSDEKPLTIRSVFRKCTNDETV